MCRLLYVRSENQFKIQQHLQSFAVIAKNSKEYQGHGWGCSYLKDDIWQHYKNIKPIWEDDLEQFAGTTILVAHARSAFRDKDIRVENNMPFASDNWIYIFNGELHGVKIREQGRIGAEKIFNFILRFYKPDMELALKKAVNIIEKRSQHIRAMNIILADRQAVYVSSLFNEDEDYFTVHYKQDNSTLVICSEPYAGEKNWQKMTNRTIRKF